MASSAQTVESLASFNGTNGGNPVWGSMVQGTNGNYYGTTLAGTGASSFGTVFELTSGNQLSALYNFCSLADCADGESPQGGLVRATSGNFYGTTNSGGGHNDGTVFEITPAGKLTTLHSFDGTDGKSPIGGLVQGSNGNFYGTTQEGGANQSGTVFEITPAGKLTTLYNFCSQNTPTNCADGELPYGVLMQATNGNLYGTTQEGGSVGFGNEGTVFSLSAGLHPFVETLTTAGKVGANVVIVGNNLTSASSVAFNGTATKPATVSATKVTAKVPAGATTGLVTVTTSAGTLTSTQSFGVKPQITSFTPASGAVGTQVTITGVSLEAPKVTFGGVMATSILLNSDTEVTAFVPTGAKTGHIAITTKGGSATSSGVFTVTP